MKLSDLITKYQNKLKEHSDDFSCLFFALQIPSICARIVFPQTEQNTGNSKDGKYYKRNGEPWDANIYKAWLRVYSNYFVDIYKSAMTTHDFCNSIYNLRCQLTHTGIIMSENNKYYFVKDGLAMGFNNIIFIPIQRLCIDMFRAAKMMLTRLNKDIDITLFEEMLIPTDIYNKITSDISATYNYFWEKYSELDHLLNIIYTNLIYDNPGMKEKIDMFFKENPELIYEIWDFSYLYGGIYDPKKIVIQEDYDESKSLICSELNENTDVLRLTRTQYERMLQVRKELDEFSSKNNFSILDYIKKETK